MEIADLTESIKKRHPELRDLNPQDFATHIDQLGGSMLKTKISKIVIALNTMVGKYNDDLLENTNQAQLFAELGNYDASFALIGNLCSYLQGQSGLSDDEKQAINNIQRLRSLLTDLLKRNQFSLTIGDSTGTITIDSTENRKVLIFFLLEYGAEIDALRNGLDQFIEGQGCSETAEIL